MRCSARLKASAAAAMSANSTPNKLWCSCQQPENNRFVIYCDVHGEGCKIWYHGDCVGITKAQGRHLEQTGEQYVCPICLSATATSSSDQIESVPSSGTQLPIFSVMSPPSFLWKDASGEFFVKEISAAYDIAAHRRRNLFVVPFGKVGRAFVQELARLFPAYGEGGSLECIAIKAAMVMCVLYYCRNHTSLPGQRTLTPVWNNVLICGIKARLLIC